MSAHIDKRPFEELRVFFSALMFLTRVPCPLWVGYDPSHLPRSVVYFPVVGLLVGTAGAAAFLLLNAIWQGQVALVGALATTVLLTGALHEDGLADTADGIGGGVSVTDKLAIMKDSRIGSYGVLGLFFVLAAKLAALGMLPASEVALVLIVGHTLSRWASLPLLYWGRYLREESQTSKPFAESVTKERFMASTAIAVVITLLLLRGQGIVALLAVVAVSALALEYFRRVLGGVTGDTVGATVQLTELTVYLTVAAR